MARNCVLSIDPVHLLSAASFSFLSSCCFEFASLLASLLGDAAGMMSQTGLCAAALGRWTDAALLYLPVAFVLDPRIAVAVRALQVSSWYPC